MTKTVCVIIDCSFLLCLSKLIVLLMTDFLDRLATVCIYNLCHSVECSREAEHAVCVQSVALQKYNKHVHVSDTFGVHKFFYCYYCSRKTYVTCTQ